MSFARLFQSCRNFFKSEAELLQEKNFENAKVKGYLSSSESQKIFKVAFEMLQEVPFDSMHADIIIAGAAIWAMSREDDKYFDWHGRNTPATPSLYRLKETRSYPHKTLYEIEKICSLSLTGFLSDFDLQHNIKEIGSRALFIKDLGFDGTIAAFKDTRFLDSDWSQWTDRFDKYNLEVSAPQYGLC